MRQGGLGLNVFQERPYGASGIQENLLAAVAPPRTPLLSLQRFPNPLAGGEGASFPSPKPHPHVGTLSLWLRPFEPHG